MASIQPIRRINPTASRRRARVVGALALLLAACGAAPKPVRAVEVLKGDEVRIAYAVQTASKGQMTLELQTLGERTKEDFYRSKQTGLQAKVADDPYIQGLLDALATYGYFERAVPGNASEAKQAILVSINGEQTAWPRPPIDPNSAASMKTFEAFRDAAEFVREAYNRVESFHSVKGLSVDDLRNIDAHQAAKNDASKRDAARRAEETRRRGNRE